MATSGTKEYLTAYEKEFIEKYDGEAGNNGTTFDPTDTSKAKLVTITDDYQSTVFSAGNYSALVTIDGSSRKNPIYITGNTLKNRISTGSGDDTLTGGDGNDSLTGGSGADVFITSQGKDYVTDYSATDGDKIMLNGVTPTKVKVSKQNVVITNSDKSTFTIVNGKGVMLNAIDSNGNAINQLNQAFGETEFTATTGTTVVDATLNTSLKKIDGTNATGTNYKTATNYDWTNPGLSDGVSLIGNTAANTIIGSNFVNNTIYGGAGKDILFGGSGTQVSVYASSDNPTPAQVEYIENTFVFTEGNGANTISNYNSSHDKIWIKSGTVTGYSIKKDDVILTVALNGKKKTTITVKDAKNKTITFLQNDGTPDNVNTKVYRNSTDYIVTTEESVTSALTGDKTKLIDAASEYASIIGYRGEGSSRSTVYRSTDVSLGGYGHNGVYLQGNKIANTIIGSKYEDTITGGAGKDTIYGGHSTVSGDAYHPDVFIYTVGDGADVIVDYQGTSDITKTDAIVLGPNTNIASSSINTKKGAQDVVLTTATPTGKNKSTLTLKNSTDQYITIVKSDGTTVSPQKYGQTSLKAGTDIYAVNNVLDIGFNTKATTLDASTYDTTAWLIGNSSKNVLIGSTLAGNTLQGAGGNDTLYGAKGQADVFLYGSSDGTDAIFDFESGTDLIKLASSDVHITASAVVTKKGANDVQLTIGKSKVLIKGIADTLAGTNAKGKAVTLYNPQKIKIADSDGFTYAMNYGSTLDKITDDDIADGATMSFAANTQIQVIDAGAYIKDTTTVQFSTDSLGVVTSETVLASSTRARTKAMHIIGNAKANTLIGGQSGGNIYTNSNDKLVPNTATPGIVTTLTGGKGNDVFMLTSGGNLIITDYNANAKKEADKIQLSEGQAINGSSVVTVDNRNDLVLEVITQNGDSALTGIYNNITLVGAKDKEITVIDSSGASNAQTYGSNTITLTNKTSNNILVDNSIIAVTNESRTKAIKITSTGTRSTVDADIPAVAGGLSIEGGKGNDTLNGGPSDGGIVSLTGGAGKDVFMHSNGMFTEIITDYEAGKDKLRFIEGIEIDSLETLNADPVTGIASDVHLHFSYTRQVGNVDRVNNGDVTLKGAGGQKVTIARERTETYVDKKGVTQTRIVTDESTQIFGAAEISVTDNDGSLIDASDAANGLYLRYVDASSRSAKKPITIRGNATGTVGNIEGYDGKFQHINENTLIGGKGNDTIYSSKISPSGTKNKTEITGGAGADYFYYYGGNVTITDYAWNKKAAKSDVIVFPSDVGVTALSNLIAASDVTASLTPSTLTANSANTGKIRFDGEDVVFIFGSNADGITDSLRIKDAKDKNITILNSTGDTISSTEVYSNPYEWRIDNKTEATVLEDINPTGKKAIYVDENFSDTSKLSIYTAISASARSKAATIQGAKADTQYVLTGGKAADKLIGNEQINTLVGGKGNDTLQANGGGTTGDSSKNLSAAYNILTGGDGKDVFYFNPTASTAEYDVITDYQVGKDVLRLPENYFVITAENVSVRPTGFSTTTTLTGVQASVAADGSGGADIVRVKKKTVARNMTGVTPNDVRLIIGRTTNNAVETVGSVTVWDAGGYSSMVDLTQGVSVGAIGAYKITVAQESTNAKGKTVVTTSALDLISTEVVVANADGTTIDVTANPNVVNIVPQTSKPARTKAMYVIGNAKANSIEGTAKADTLVGGGHSAETVAGLVDTLTGGKGNDVFILDGKGDVIITDYSAEKSNYDKVRLGNNVELTNGVASGTNLVFTYHLGTSDVNHYATLQGAASTKITLVSSDGQSGAQVYGADAITIANADGSKVDVSSNQNVKSMDASKRTKNVWLVGNANTSTILGGKKNDTIDTSKLAISTAVTGAVIDAGAGADSVYGSTGADQVTLGAGNDTFITNGGNDTVETGAGKDLVIYNGQGTLTVTDYDGKNDRIELRGTIDDAATPSIKRPISMLGYTINTDTSVVLNLGYKAPTDTLGSSQNHQSTTHSIVLQNVTSGSKLSITDAQGITETITLTDPNTLLVTNTDGGNISPTSSTYLHIDASKRTTPVEITGSEYVVDIKGGTKADTITLARPAGGTITGGKGNDTLKASSAVTGVVTYAYTTGDGADVITNYKAGDIIALGSAKTKVNETKSQKKGDNYLLAIGSSVITLKGAGSTEISVLSYGETTPTKYNTTSTTTSARTASYEERIEEVELFKDDNIITYDTADDISSILQPEYQVATQTLDDTTALNPTAANLTHLTTNNAELRIRNSE